MSVTFNEPISLGTGTFTMYQEPLTTSSGITSIDTTTSATNVTSDFTATLSNDNQTVTFTLIGGGAIDRTAGQTNVGYLTNGIYQLVLNGSGITDAATGTATFNSGGNAPVSFANARPRQLRDRPVYFSVLCGDRRHGVAQHPGRWPDLANTNGTTDSGYLDYYDTGSLNIQSARDFNRDYTVDYSY